MFKLTSATLICFLGFSTALPTDPILRKFDDVRYQHVRDSSGQYHLVDLWMKLSDLSEASRYTPAADNVYHLFTRANPTSSQPLVIGNSDLLRASQYSSNRRTILLIHGWRDNVLSDFNTVLVPAFLAAEDLNVIVVDWSAGSSTINYATVLTNTITSGRGVGAFINWLNQESGSTASQYHIVGHGIGGHQAGIAARNVQGTVSYVTGLDPALAGWVNHSDRFQETDGSYTEVIHTNCGVYGYPGALAHVDFYPNNGQAMPGCDSHVCDHARVYFYFAESLISGGFTGRQCTSYLAALLNACWTLSGQLQMGGLTPKTGASGVYHVTTNAAPPFSQG